MKKLKRKIFVYREVRTCRNVLSMMGYYRAHTDSAFLILLRCRRASKRIANAVKRTGVTAKQASRALKQVQAALQQAHGTTKQ